MSVANGLLKQRANVLQEKANILQQKMIGVMERNNDVTSRYNTRMLWLTGAIVFLALITLWTNYNKTGRYAISSMGGANAAFVLDTKTSKLWVRRMSESIYYLGTNETPKRILIESKAEPKQ